MMASHGRQLGSDPVSIDSGLKNTQLESALVFDSNGKHFLDHEPDNKRSYRDFWLTGCMVRSVEPHRVVGCR